VVIPGGSSASTTVELGTSWSTVGGSGGGVVKGRPHFLPSAVGAKRAVFFAAAACAALRGGRSLVLGSTMGEGEEVGPQFFYGAWAVPVSSVLRCEDLDLANSNKKELQGRLRQACNAFHKPNHNYMMVLEAN
jgi:hypothetical protein